MKTLMGVLLLLPASWLDARAGEFPCPDELSRELFADVIDLYKVHPLSKAEPVFTRVIEQASKRQMDDRPLRYACRGLAYRTFRTDCADYGYTCPGPGDNPIDWPAQINEWTRELKANVPVLQLCPDNYIRLDPILPIVRVKPVFPQEVIDERITGWVTLTLDIDEFGEVADAQVSSSTSSKLEMPALDAVRQFQYRRKRVEDGFVGVKGVSATVYVSYWSLAEAAGCFSGSETRY